jgi:hypothetical protein
MRLSPLLALPFVAACGGRSSSAPPIDDAGTGGGPGDEAQAYTPEGCHYTYTAPSALAYMDWALDDTSPFDPSTGVPKRVRLGLGGATTKGQPGYADPTTTAAFTWETDQPNHAAKVRIGASAAALTQIATGYSWTAQPLLGKKDAYLHEVHVCGLTPGTTYFYQVGGGPAGAEVWSATQSFTTMPSAGPVSIAVFGDARDSDTTWQAVHARMRDQGIGLSLVSGDVVDIGGLEPLYQQWLDAIWKDPNDGTKFLTLGQQYILPIDGNHENDSALSFANWALPGDGPYAETFASFDVGAAHITMIDDEQIAGAPTGDEAKAQLAWIDQDLKAAAADRATHPFIVVVSHRGLFSTSLHSADPDVSVARGALAPLFDRYGVDIAYNGHDHEYERTVPIRAGSPPTTEPIASPQGTTYVICAGAGADPYAVGTADVAWRATKTAFGPSASPAYLGVYAIMTIAPAAGTTPAKLTLTAYGLNASSSTVAGDAVIDTFVLMR